MDLSFETHEFHRGTAKNRPANKLVAFPTAKVMEYHLTDLQTIELIGVSKLRDKRSEANVGDIKSLYVLTGEAFALDEEAHPTRGEERLCCCLMEYFTELIAEGSTKLKMGPGANITYGVNKVHELGIPI